MPLIILAIGLTVFSVVMARKFVLDLRRGVIWTKLGDVDRATMPRRFAFLRMLNFALFPIAKLMMAGVWILAIRDLMK